MSNVPNGSQLINVGTAENPILVPKTVVIRDGSDHEKEWWNALANGSVTLPAEVLSKLLSLESADARKDE